MKANVVLQKLKTAGSADLLQSFGFELVDASLVYKVLTSCLLNIAVFVALFDLKFP